MLKKITLAALLAVGAATMTGLAAQPAAADSFYAGIVVGPGHHHGTVYHHRRGWRAGPIGHRHQGHRFLRRVARGDIVCYRTRPWRHGYRHHGRRLGYHEVKRLAAHGRWHAMRCFSRF